jgi:hypothetical protein
MRKIYSCSSQIIIRIIARNLFPNGFDYYVRTFPRILLADKSATVEQQPLFRLFIAHIISQTVYCNFNEAERKYCIVLACSFFNQYSLLSLFKITGHEMVLHMYIDNIDQVSFFWVFFWESITIRSYCQLFILL